MKSEYNEPVLTVFPEGKIHYDNADNFKILLNNELNKYSISQLVLDMSFLEYISSAGLRVLLQLRRKFKSPIRVINVKPEVYEIFTASGFSDFFEIERAPRDISMQQQKLIFDSINGKIYALADETMVKVFRPNVSYETVKNERDFAHEALIYDIPTVIPFDVVKVHRSYGIVFESIRMFSVANAIAANPGELDTYAIKFAHFLRSLHEKNVSGSHFPNIKDRYREWLNTSKARLSPEDYHLINVLVNDLAEYDTYVHGEITLNNVMIHNGEMLLMDTAGSSHGHPLFDLQGLYASLIKMEMDAPMYCSTNFGISAANCRRFWDVFIHTYMENNTEQDLERLQSLLDSYYVLKQKLVSKL